MNTADYLLEFGNPADLVLIGDKFRYSYHDLHQACERLYGELATAGVAVMGSDRGADISSAGLALAFAMAFSMAMTTVAFRKHRDAGFWPIGCLSNALTVALSAFLAHPFAVTPPDLAYLLLFALVQMTLGLGLFVMGTRRLPAADAAVIGLIEAPLAPLWVWVALR